jgi:hypothetical protein
MTAAWAPRRQCDIVRRPDHRRSASAKITDHAVKLSRLV